MAPWSTRTTETSVIADALARQTPFAKEVTAAEHGHDGGLPLLREYGQLDGALFNEEYGVRWITLGEDYLLLLVGGNLSRAGLRQEGVRIPSWLRGERTLHACRHATDYNTGVFGEPQSIPSASSPTARAQRAGLRGGG